METSQVSALRGNLGVCQLPSGLTAAPSFLKIFKSSLRVRKIQGLKIRVDFLLYLLLRWADKQTFLLGVARKLCGRDAGGLALKCNSPHVCSNVQVGIRIFLMYVPSSFSIIAKKYTFLEREASYSEVHKLFTRTTEHNQT